MNLGSSALTPSLSWTRCSIAARCVSMVESSAGYTLRIHFVMAQGRYLSAAERERLLASIEAASPGRHGRGSTGQKRRHWSSLSPPTEFPLPVGFGLFSLHCRLPLTALRWICAPLPLPTTWMLPPTRLPLTRR